MHQLFLLTINGNDHPGVTAAFTATLGLDGILYLLGVRDREANG